MIVNFDFRSVLVSSARYATALLLGLALTAVLTIALIVADTTAWMFGQFTYASSEALVAGMSGLFGWGFKAVFLVIVVSLVSLALRRVCRTKGHYITYVLGSLIAGSTVQLGTELFVGLQYCTIAAILLIPVVALRVPTRVNLH